MNWFKARWPWLVGIVVAFVIGVAAGGGSDSGKSTTTAQATRTVTQTTTTPVVKYRTRYKTHYRTRTVTVSSPTPAPTPSPSSGGGGGSLSWSGNGGKNLGTINVPSSGTLHWTNDGAVFQILDDEDGVMVNSQGHSGTSAVDAGSYHHVFVNAVGNWTISIR